MRILVLMSELVISLRPARPTDAVELAAVHDAAWREAYRGVLPGVTLEQMLARRGPRWWRKAVTRPRRISVVDFGGRLAGYAIYGPTRSPNLPQGGEIDELYIDPVMQGIGLGTRLFAAARHELAAEGHRGLVVWALADNERACRFYERLGGRVAAEANAVFGGQRCPKVAYTFA